MIFFSHAVRLAAPGQPTDTEQMAFRREESAAYYAVFHLVTMTAAESWAVGRERHRFARLFEHGKLPPRYLVWVAMRATWAMPTEFDPLAKRRCRPTGGATTASRDRKSVV